jgi:hypothetical protein
MEGLSPSMTPPLKLCQCLQLTHTSHTYILIRAENICNYMRYNHILIKIKKLNNSLYQKIQMFIKNELTRRLK